MSAPTWGVIVLDESGARRLERVFDGIEAARRHARESSRDGLRRVVRGPDGDDATYLRGLHTAPAPERAEVSGLGGTERGQPTARTWDK